MIEVRNLSKVYGPRIVVDDLSFRVRTGVVTGFLGPRGAGKSTTLRMILGLERPTAGEALIGGRRYAELRQPLRCVGALLDAGWVHPRRSGRNHLRWLARAGGLPTTRVGVVLDLVGLTAVADRAAGSYSLGMRQRLGIAAALLGDPGVLIFDEPLNGLDPQGLHWFRHLVLGMAAQGRTVLVSSHLLAGLAMTTADLLVIGHGRLLGHGPTALPAAGGNPAAAFPRPAGRHPGHRARVAA